MLLATACVVPLLPRPYPATAADPVPPFFPAAARWLAPGSTVLVLPYPTDAQTVPLVWQGRGASVGYGSTSTVEPGASHRAAAGKNGGTGSAAVAG